MRLMHRDWNVALQKIYVAAHAPAPELRARGMKRKGKSDGIEPVTPETMSSNSNADLHLTNNSRGTTVSEIQVSRCHLKFFLKLFLILGLKRIFLYQT